VDDLVQSAWERLFAHNARDLRKWAPEHGLGLRGYVGLVAGRDVIDMLHAQSAPVSPSDDAIEVQPSGAPSPEIELGSREMLLQVVRTLRAELSTKGAAVFQLLILEDHPVAHVCSVLGMKQDAVFQWRSRIAHRAREIARRLSDDAREPES
jgi:DNA-directed RNA polymerase specialized sigma24 family protein